VRPRSLPPPAFAGDIGTADPALAAALQAAADDAGRLPEVLAVLHHARVLTPVLAVATEAATGASGMVEDKRADMAVPLLEGEDGRRALPVFSSLDALSAWDAAARPVPVEGRRAALVAVSEGAEVLVIDVAGPVSCVLEEVEVRALAQGRGTIPAYDDVGIARTVADRLEAHPEVTGAWLSPAPGVDAHLALRLSAVVEPEQVATALAAVGRTLAADPVIGGAAIRGFEIALATPTTSRGRSAFGRDART
jgi:type III secretion system (T3SS) SseB-like protein